MADIISTGRNVKIGGGNAVIMLGRDGATPVQIAYCKTFNETPPSRLTQPVVIQGIGDKRPVEIIPPQGIWGEGTIALTVYEFFAEHAWKTIDSNFPTSQVASEDMSEMGFWDYQYKSGTKFVITRLVAKGGLGSGNSGFIRTYHNCVITGISEGGNQTSVPDIGEVTSNITFTFTHYTEKVIDNNS